MRFVEDTILHPLKTDPNYKRFTKVFGKTDQARRNALFQGGPSAACGGAGWPFISDYGIYIAPSGMIVYDMLCDSTADINPSTVLAGTMNNNLVVAFYAQRNTDGKPGI